MKLLFNEYTDTGKKRSVNEDYCGKWHNRLIDGYVFCVADGMGGYGFGDAASKIAVYSVIKDFALLKKNDVSPRQLILNMFDNAQTRLKNYKVKKNIDLFGTTLSVMLFLNDITACANIGDTRIYSSKHSQLILESFDHNFVQELLHAGEITKEQAEHHPKKHMLTKALTGDSDSDVEPFIKISPYSPDTTYMIASDGLYRMLNEQEIMALLTNYGQNSSAENILQKVYDRGAIDNITFQVIRPAESGEDRM
jgi:protein phosphatase